MLHACAGERVLFVGVLQVCLQTGGFTLPGRSGFQLRGVFHQVGRRLRYGTDSTQVHSSRKVACEILVVFSPTCVVPIVIIVAGGSKSCPCILHF